MNLIPDELKTQTFPCPNCRQYVSSIAETCKFCNIQLTDEIKSESVRRELEEKRKVNLNWHKNTILVGIITLTLGLFFLISSVIELNYSNNVNINCLTPILLIGGIVITMKGAIGYKREKERF